MVVQTDEFGRWRRITWKKPGNEEKSGELNNFASGSNEFEKKETDEM
jgi:hypothetical protein